MDKERFEWWNEAREIVCRECCENFCDKCPVQTMYERLQEEQNFI